MITYLNSRNRQIVTRKEGAIVGKLDDFQFDLMTRRVYGYRLKGAGMFSKAGGVNAQVLDLIGRDVAFIGAEDQVEWKGGGARNAQEGRAWASQYRGTRVMSRSGTALGAVEDFVFDPTEDAVRALILDDQRVVQLDERVATGPAAVIVESEALLQEQPQTAAAQEEWWRRIMPSASEPADAE